MDYSAVERARERLEAAAKNKTQPGDIDAALDRARAQIEELAAVAAHLEASLPAQVGEAVQEGIRNEALPVARQVAEVRGLANQTIRRLERIEGDNLAERHARVDDLGLLVDLITSGWQTVDERLTRIERNLEESGGAIVYRIQDAQDRARTG
jgi:chorismate mutase